MSADKPDARNISAELPKLLALLKETQDRISHLTGGVIDAVIQPSGIPFLLGEAQKGLRDSEILQRAQSEELSAILDALPAHIALLDRSGNVLGVNSAWRRFASANVFEGENAGVGQNYIDICDRSHGDCSDEAPAVAEGIRSVISGAAPLFALEYPCHSPDEQRWYRVMVTPLTVKRPGPVVVMHVDVSERKRAENDLLVTAEAHRKQSELLTRVIEGLHEGLLVLDAEGRVLVANKYVNDFLGYEVLGRHRDELIEPLAYRDYLTGDVVEKDELPSNRAIAGETVFDRLLVLSNAKTRQEVIISHSAAPLWAANGSTDGAVLWFRDVTAEMQADRDRTEMQARLARSERLESVGQLAGGVAHDFNNLLTVICGNSEILLEALEDNDPSGLLPLVEQVVEAGNRGADLTHRLLAFSRKQDLKPELLDLNKQVQKLTALIRRTLAEDIEIVEDLAPDLEKVLADRGNVENALLNLAVNARDAMPNGGRLTMRTRNARITTSELAGFDAAPGEFAIVEVRDTGTGMPAEVQARVFEPFFTTKDLGKGTGLGLAMAHGFVKQSGGFIRVESELGKGTTISIGLPQVKNHTLASPDAVASATRTGQGQKILVVEDDPHVRQILDRMLRTIGYQVVATANGPEALEVARNDSDLALMLTDVIMPGGINGWELAQTVRKIGYDMPILFSTGYADHATLKLIKNDTNSRILSKPFKTKDLAALISEMLDRSSRNEL